MLMMLVLLVFSTAFWLFIYFTGKLYDWRHIAVITAFVSTFGLCVAAGNTW